MLKGQRQRNSLNVPRMCRGLSDQLFEHAAIHVLERLDVGNFDMFVDLVDAGVQRAELDHLLADARDEAAVRRAACVYSSVLTPVSSLIAFASALSSSPCGVKNGCR